MLQTPISNASKIIPTLLSSTSSSALLFMMMLKVTVDVPWSDASPYPVLVQTCEHLVVLLRHVLNLGLSVAVYFVDVAVRNHRRHITCLVPKGAGTKGTYP